MAKSGGGAGRETDSAPDTKKRMRLKKPAEGGKYEATPVNPDAAPSRTALQRGIAGIRKRAAAARQPQ